jgi:autotransporter-associated beta strand protein
VTNPITFRGRNNNSTGVQNLSGTNSLAGTISLQAGGSVYWIDSDAGTLNLTNTLSAAASGARQVTLRGNGTGVVSGAIQDGSGTVSTSKDGGGTWTLSGNNTYTGATAVQNGTLRIGNNLTHSSAVTVSGGTLELPSNGTQLRVIKTGSITVTGMGKIDVSDNKLIATASPAGTWNGSAYTDITGVIASGRNGSALPLWDGAGIVTSQSQATGGNFTSIGVAQGSDLFTAATTWGGQSVALTDTLVMYTYCGDATLDGRINIDDYVKIDNGIAGGLHGWVNGDFNYDGVINIDDYTTCIDANIGNQNGFIFPTAGGIEGGPAGGVSPVPEPAAATLVLAMISAGLLRLRHRLR